MRSNIVITGVEVRAWQSPRQDTIPDTRYGLVCAFERSLEGQTGKHYALGEVDARSDLWAVGIMMLLGAHPIDPLTTDALTGVAQLEVLWERM